MQATGEREDDFRLHCGGFLRGYASSLGPGRDVEEPWLVVAEFLDLLFSRENTIWRGDELEAYDFTRPLSHYWIASSHNTYLTGDQLRSDSSLDAYSRALLMGCRFELLLTDRHDLDRLFFFAPIKPVHSRCVELDCWDGQKKSKAEQAAEGPITTTSNANPALQVIIFHGHTMTTKLALRDVLNTIRQYAFVTSDLPLILSIEDNCSVPCQRVLASDLSEILGDFLVTAPVDKDELCLPSPASLRRRIILKHKKLPTEATRGLVTAGSSSSTLMSVPATPSSFSVASEPEEESDILNRDDYQKKGVLLAKDPETGLWAPRLFIAFPERLYYTDAGEAETRRRGISTGSMLSFDPASVAAGSSTRQPDDEEGADSLDSTMPGVKPEEMHITEEWFHGRITRDDARKLLKQHGPSLGDGTFLVRESNTFIGDFSLSFWFRGEAHHCRIRTKMVGGEKRYYFLEPRTMETLYELICYYTKHSLTTPKFRTVLRTACPQPSPHETEPWFLGAISKAKAEELLNAFREDGAFLFRLSSSDASVFVLSIRVDGAIWHMRLKREGRIFLVNQTIFENLCLLVKYYQEHTLFRGVCLKFPVNEEEVAKYCSTDTTFTPEGCYMDLAGMDSGQELDAVGTVDHVAHEPDQLAFSNGDVIAIIRKADGGGPWFGRCHGRSGWFDPKVSTVPHQSCGFFLR